MSKRIKLSAYHGLMRRSTLLICGGAFLLSLCCSAGQRSTPESGSLRAADKPEAVSVTIYDPAATHLWNRVHGALFLRTTSEGKTFGLDELEPLLWPESKYLLVGKHHQDVLGLLDEFLAKEGHKLIADPLKRVVFQHDLWAVFDWLAHPNVGYQYRDDNFTPEARQLQIRLAKVIRRLALSADQIQQLPDTFAEAITSKAFPTHHNLQQPEQAFLPADLFEPQGPWVLLGEHMAPAAPLHVRLLHARCAVFVFLNLPAGRKDTLDYLEKLSKFPNALLAQSADKPAELNPDLPQFPAGTQVALVREMLTIDDQLKIRPTRHIQSIQFRVYREIPQGGSNLKGKQDFYEFRSTRKDLFSRTHGGLHAVGPNDEEVNALLPIPGPDDPFDDGRPGTSHIMQFCVGCHSRPGIHSVEAYRRSFIRKPRPSQLRPYDRSQQEEAAMLQKWENYSWGLLQGLLAGE